MRGTRSLDRVRRVIEAHMEEFRRCAVPTGFTGRLVLTFVIGEDGGVRDASAAQGTTGPATVSRCLAGALEKLRFPASPGGGASVVTVTFTVQ